LLRYRYCYAFSNHALNTLSISQCRTSHFTRPSAANTTTTSVNIIYKRQLMINAR